MSQVSLCSKADILKLKQIYYTSLAYRIKEEDKIGELHDGPVLGNILGWIQTYLEHCFVTVESRDRDSSCELHRATACDQGLDPELQQLRKLEEEVQCLAKEVDSIRQQALASAQQYSLSYLQQKHKVLEHAPAALENERPNTNKLLSPDAAALTHSYACTLSKMPPLRARLQENLERLDCVLSAVKADHSRSAAMSPSKQHAPCITAANSPGPRHFPTISKRRKLERVLREATCPS
eukprot:jgi/Botrbrau1/17885/Bobra.0498s0003.2